MPIDQNYEGNIRVETNVGGDIVNLEETEFRSWQYGRNQQREPRRERLQRDAEASQAQQQAAEPSKPPAKRKRRTKAEIEADKKRDQKLKEAHDKDLKAKNLK